MSKRHAMGVCAVPECGPQKIVGRGLCAKHWQLFKRKGTLHDCARKIAAVGEQAFSPENTKPCGTCKRELHMDCFVLNPSKRYPLRRKSVCKDCDKASAKDLRDARTSQGLCQYCETPAINGSNRCEFHRRERMRWRATPTARIASILSSTRARAKDRGLLCDLDEEWIRTRLAGACELTGLPFDFESGKSIGRFNPYAPSVDRRIAGGNYTKDNCRMIVMALNVGINYWGEEIYRHIAKAYLKQRKEQKKRRESSIDKYETYNLLIDNPQSVRTRKPH
jgi:hypothetical protein